MIDGMNEDQSPEVSPLQTLGRKFQVVIDHVTAVAKGYKTGFFLYGQGGVGKSYNVIRRLEEIDAPHVLYNSRMTGKGLFASLMAAPDAIHVLEDMERLTKDPDAQGVLRSALWSQPGRDRVVTWTTATDGKVSFSFRGGVILISNRPLADLPELRALATRIEVHRLEVSEAELIALMRELAGKGYRHRDNVGLGPEECLRVTEHLLRECRASGCPLDLRLQQKSFQTYLQWAADLSVTNWADLVAASVREATHQFRHQADTLSTEDRKARRRNILREVMAKGENPKQQEDEYCSRTGASRADLYRRRREIESTEFDEQDAAK